MTPASIDDYLDRLRRELHQRGFEDPRLIEEAREHLADAIDAGLRRGLRQEQAEREAFDRFGPPEVVARSTIHERTGMRNRLNAVLSTLWRWKWWLIAPTVVAAVTSSAISFFFLPTRYRSVSIIQVESPAEPPLSAGTRSTVAQERFERIAERALTRAQLEALITDVGLYADERTREPLDNVVRRMRRDIGVLILTDERRQQGNAGGTFLVSFESPDPRLAMQTTARLAGLFIDGNLREPNVASLEPKQAGFLFRITEPARIPNRPVGPSQFGVSAAGTLAGLGLGALLVGIRGRSTAAT